VLRDSGVKTGVIGVKAEPESMISEREKGFEPSTSTLAKGFEAQISLVILSKDKDIPLESVSGRPTSSRSSGDESGDANSISERFSGQPILDGRVGGEVSARGRVVLSRPCRRRLPNIGALHSNEWATRRN
jgi:hypothetical protein